MVLWRVLFLLFLSVLLTPEVKSGRRAKESPNVSNNNHVHSHLKAEVHEERKDNVNKAATHKSRDRKTSVASEERGNSPLSEIVKSTAKIDESDKQELDSFQDYNKQFVNNEMASESAELASHGIDDDSALKISNMAVFPNRNHHEIRADNKALIGLGNGLKASYGKDFDQDSLLYDESKWPEYRIKDSDYSEFPTFAQPLWNPNQGGEIYDPQVAGSPFNQGEMPASASAKPNEPQVSKEKHYDDQFAEISEDGMVTDQAGSKGKKPSPKKAASNKLLSHEHKAAQPSSSVGENTQLSDMKVHKKPKQNLVDSGIIKNNDNFGQGLGSNSSKHTGKIHQKPDAQMNDNQVNDQVNASQLLGNKSMSKTKEFEGPAPNLITSGAPVSNTAPPISANSSAISVNFLKQNLKQGGQKINEPIEKGFHLHVKLGNTALNQSGSGTSAIGSNPQKGNEGSNPAKQSYGAINIKEAIREAVKARVQSEVRQEIKEAQDQISAPNQIKAITD